MSVEFVSGDVQFTPVDGPPPSLRGKVHDVRVVRYTNYDPLLDWCDEHPGRWARVEDVYPSTVARWKKSGYEACQRGMSHNLQKYTAYVRRPEGWQP